MKKLLFILLLALGCAHLQAQDEYGNFSRNIINYNRDYTYNQVANMYNQHYNIPVQKINELYISFNKSWGDLQLGLELSRYLNIPINTIHSSYIEYGGGKGWGALAKRHGIKPGSAEFHRFKQMMNSEDLYWKNTCKKYKGHKNPKFSDQERRNYPERLMKNPASYERDKSMKDDNMDNKRGKGHQKEHKSKKDKERGWERD